MAGKSKAKAEPESALEVEQSPELSNEGSVDVSAQSGDGGAREIEIGSAMDRIEALAGEINLVEDRGAIIAKLTEALVELFKRRPKPWDQLSQLEQRDLARGLENVSKEAVRQISEEIASEGQPAIRALLESYTDKDGVKAVVKVRAIDPDEELAAVVGLHQAKGKIVLIRVANPDDFARSKPRDLSEPDQKGLGFEAGNDGPPAGPAGDADLVEAAEAPPREELAQTGMQMLVPNYGLREIRVDLKSGMVQARSQEGGDSWDIDVREATSVEIAAERDRIADFDDEAEARREAEAAD